MSRVFKRFFERVFPLGFKKDFKVLARQALPIVFGGLSQSLMPVQNKTHF
jgi:Na+-driven multidrug efflux pump